MKNQFTDPVLDESTKNMTEVPNSIKIFILHTNKSLSIGDAVS